MIPRQALSTLRRLSKGFPIVALTGLAAAAVHLAGAPAFATFLVVVTGALVLLGQGFGRVTFRTLFYLPHLTAGVATLILWKALYSPETGPVNALIRPALAALTAAVHATPAAVWHGLGGVLAVGACGLLAAALTGLIGKFRDADIGLAGLGFGALGVAVVAALGAGLGWVVMQLPAWVETGGTLQVPTWLVSTTWAKPALMLMGIIVAMGSNSMLLYLAALSNVPVELYEAAAIDGANRWRTFWNVTWPQLAPTTFFIVIMGTIGGLQGGFEQARVLTNGGPAGSTTTLSYYLYLRGFTDFRLGFASAIAWTMFVMIFAMTLINWRFGNKMVND